MLPAGNSPSSKPRRASETVRWSTSRSQRVPKSSATRGTPVSSTSTSAPIAHASRSEQRSLSITHATPTTSSPCRATGMPAAAAGDHDRAVLEQHRGVLVAEHLQRLRARHDAAPAAAGVRRDVPAAGLGEALGLLLAVERPDGLGRVREGPVVEVDQHARQQHGDRHRRVQGGERALQQVADLPLGGRDQRVQRQRRGLLLAERLLQQQRADLRAVAVGQHDLVALRAQRQHRLRDLAHVGELLVPGPDLPGLHDRVPADRDDDAHPGTWSGHVSYRIRPCESVASRIKAWTVGTSPPASILGYDADSFVNPEGEQWRSQT